ncbi:hypothetical protein VIGAN_05018700 [Vigna angularis var. angularis]|uniref:Uncharacterized protein n=1 Tax=Vigna angularis var. angularis TaxID=157739 RepID=A0A0S3S205_PHAAN|nr:hypothetical protein VIGAN_05018700 [Vigna angularis var. angularis]
MADLKETTTSVATRSGLLIKSISIAFQQIGENCSCFYAAKGRWCTTATWEILLLFLVLCFPCRFRNLWRRKNMEAVARF